MKDPITEFLINWIGENYKPPMPTKPLESYERVPYRGTHYVEAAALDQAVERIMLLERQLNPKLIVPESATKELDTRPSALSEEEGVDETSDDFKALEAVATKLRCAKLDDLNPQMILDRFDAAEANAKQLFDDAERFKKQAEDASALVARMHAAAVGEIKGPERGVVEDVEDLRTWYLNAVDGLNRANARIAAT